MGNQGQKGKQKTSRRRLRARQILLLSTIICAILAAALFINPDSDRPALRGPASVKTEADTIAEQTPSAKHIQGIWQLTKPADNHQIEGYATSDSVLPGDKFALAVSCDHQQIFKVELFRMGWYKGNGAKLVRTDPKNVCMPQKAAVPNDATGLVNLDWKSADKIVVPSDWQSGFYLARLTDSDGFQSFIPFTVQPSEQSHKYLFIHASATDAAYNTWGGNSLYKGYTKKLRISRAVEVSLNRPFAVNNGAGQFLNWEYPMVRFLERSGYPVDYATDTDIQKNPELLSQYKSVIITGHDEYWTRQMLNGYMKAVRRGTNLAIFAANTGYRPSRYQSDPISGDADRIIVCYKDPRLDPLLQQYISGKNVDLTAGSWRVWPLGFPESNWLGEVYAGETKSSAALTVRSASSWIFSGTGLHPGSSFPGIVGYEYDKFVPTESHPKRTQVPFASRVTDLISGQPNTSNSTYYQMASGGQVFNAGTIQWSWGLEPTFKDTFSPKLEKVTANILTRFAQ